MSLGERMERTQLPRRLLGAVLAVLVPGAGHIVIGYHRAGWIVAAVTAAVGAGFLAAVLACAMTWVGILGAVVILGTVASVLSIFALPPGPKLAAGLRALWPVLVLFVLFRGFAWIVQDRVLLIAPAPDDAMAPAIVKGDTVFLRLDASPAREGEVVLVESPASSGHYLIRRAAGPAPGDAVHARALFVFAAARGTNGIGRVWKPLQAPR